MSPVDAEVKATNTFNFFALGRDLPKTTVRGGYVYHFRYQIQIWENYRYVIIGLGRQAILTLYTYI